MTIACFTTHFVDSVMNMPDFWWVPNTARPLLDAGVALSYGAFDHIFVNGEPTKAYLRDTVRLGMLGGVMASPGERCKLVRRRVGADVTCEGAVRQHESGIVVACATSDARSRRLSGSCSRG